MTAPTFPEQIAALNRASELIAANGGAITRNGWGDALEPAQIALARQRSRLEFYVRCGIHDGDQLRAALAKIEGA
jgi:hypothetical protein